MSRGDDLQRLLDMASAFFMADGTFDALCETLTALCEGRPLTPEQAALYARWVELDGPQIVAELEAWEQLAARGLAPLPPTLAA